MLEMEMFEMEMLDMEMLDMEMLDEDDEDYPEILEMLKLRRRKGRVVNPDFPLPSYPGKRFPIHLAGIDCESYGYAQIATLEAWGEYVEFLKLLRENYNTGGGEVVPFEDVQEEMFVIAKVRQEEIGYYVRAEVLKKCDSSQHVLCRNIDEYEEFHSPKDQIYYGCKNTQKLAKRAIRFEFAGLSRFLGSDLLKEAYHTMEEIEPNFMAELVGTSDSNEQPVMRLRTTDGRDFIQLMLQRLYQMLGEDSPYFENENSKSEEHPSELNV